MRNRKSLRRARRLHLPAILALLIAVLALLTPAVPTLPLPPRQLGEQDALAADAGTIGPIVDISFTVSDDASDNPCLLSGYTWPANHNDLNAGAGGKFIYLCYKRSTTETPITDLKIVNIDEDQPIPSTSPCGSGWTWNNTDLNEDADGNHIYICYRRDGPSPIIDLRTITSIDIVGLDRCVTSDEWVWLKTDLNDNAGGDWVYLCYSDTRSLFDELFCGNEGEPPCGFFTRFFWENGSSGCDRSLTESSGVCVNDDRRTDVVTSFRQTWLYWALQNQRKNLNWDSSLTSVMHFGGHNAFNNLADGYLFPSQQHSITDQLRVGARFIELDIHSGNVALTGTLPELCHTQDRGHGGCVRTDRMFYNAIKEIRNWLVAEGNEDEVLILSLADVLYQPGEVRDQAGINHVNFVIDHYLNDDPRIGVFSATDFEANGSAFPSQSELVAMGKRVIVQSTDANMNPLILTSSQWPNGLNRLPSEIEEDFWSRSTCSASDTNEFDPEFKEFRTVYEDYATTGNIFVVPEIERLVECNVTILNLDAIFVDAPGIPPFTVSRDALPTLEAMVWSWTDGDRGQNGDAAVMNASTTRWYSEDLSAEHRFACLNEDGDWVISNDSGAWYEGLDACAEVDAVPGVPRNGYDDLQLAKANCEAADGPCVDLWLNYNDIATEGDWRIDQTGELVLSPTFGVVREGMDPSSGVSNTQYVYRVLDSNSTFDVVSWECGPNAQKEVLITDTGFDGTNRLGTFSCYFWDDDHPESAEDVSITIEDQFGRQITASRAGSGDRVINVVPSMGDLEVTRTGGSGDPTISFADIPFSDPGATCFICQPRMNETFSAEIDWGDGTIVVDQVVPADTVAVDTHIVDFFPVASEGILEGLSHTYDTSGDFIITVSICDDNGGCDTKFTEITVDATPPEITPVALSKDLPANPGGGSVFWYQDSVQLHWIVSDSLSEVTGSSGCDSAEVTTDMAATTFTCQASSRGGTAQRSFTFGLDATPPAITFEYETADGQPYYSDTWANQDVQVVITCDDPGPGASGVATCSLPSPEADLTRTDTFSDEGIHGPGVALLEVQDKAGNSATARREATIKIDKTSPTIMTTVRAGGDSFTPGPDVWTNQEVTVSFTCADPGAIPSGIAVNTLAGATLTEGAGQSVTPTGACTDEAGNSAALPTVSDINIDLTAPLAATGGPYVVPEGSTVELDGSGSSDNLSGVASLAWDLEGYSEFDGATIPFTDPDGPATTTARLSVTDFAGNVGAAVTTVTVTNVAPLVAVGDDATVDEQALFSRMGSFSDPGTDTWTATVDYGDGGGAQPLALDDTRFTLSHVYSDGEHDPYPVTVCVLDDDGGEGCASFAVVVLSAVEQVQLLEATIDGMQLPGNTSKSLRNLLGEISASLEAGATTDACNQLNAMTNYIEAQTGKKLTPEQAGRIIDAVTRIRTTLGCG